MLFRSAFPLFFTNVFGLTVADTAALMLVARLFDVVTDPLMGALADRTQSRWGTYRPWMIFGAVPLGVIFALLLYTPDLGPTGLRSELRSIIFTAIQDIEVALRTRIIHFFSLSHGAFWFMQLLCSSWSCMEPPLSSHASATKATASYMGRYPAHTTDEIYAQLCTLLYLEQSITPNSHIKDRLLSLLNAYPHTITRQMGFPRGWENEPLWQEPN